MDALNSSPGTLVQNHLQKQGIANEFLHPAKALETAIEQSDAEDKRKHDFLNRTHFLKGKGLEGVKVPLQLRDLMDHLCRQKIVTSVAGIGPIALFLKGYSTFEKSLEKWGGSLSGICGEEHLAQIQKSFEKEPNLIKIHCTVNSWYIWELANLKRILAAYIGGQIPSDASVEKKILDAVKENTDDEELGEEFEKWLLNHYEEKGTYIPTLAAEKLIATKQKEPKWNKRIARYAFETTEGKTIEISFSPTFPTGDQKLYSDGVRYDFKTGASESRDPFLNQALIDIACGDISTPLLFSTPSLLHIVDAKDWTSWLKQTVKGKRCLTPFMKKISTRLALAKAQLFQEKHPLDLGEALAHYVYKAYQEMLVADPDLKNCSSEVALALTLTACESLKDSELFEKEILITRFIASIEEKSAWDFSGNRPFAALVEALNTIPYSCISTYIQMSLCQILETKSTPAVRLVESSNENPDALTHTGKAIQWHLTSTLYSLFPYEPEKILEVYNGCANKKRLNQNLLKLGKLLSPPLPAPDPSNDVIASWICSMAPFSGFADLAYAFCKTARGLNGEFRTQIALALCEGSLDHAMHLFSQVKVQIDKRRLLKEICTQLKSFEDQEISLYFHPRFIDALKGLDPYFFKEWEDAEWLAQLFLKFGYKDAAAFLANQITLSDTEFSDAIEMAKTLLEKAPNGDFKKMDLDSPEKVTFYLNERLKEDPADFQIVIGLCMLPNIIKMFHDNPNLLWKEIFIPWIDKTSDPHRFLCLCLDFLRDYPPSKESLSIVKDKLISHVESHSKIPYRLKKTLEENIPFLFAMLHESREHQTLIKMATLLLNHRFEKFEKGFSSLVQSMEALLENPLTKNVISNFLNLLPARFARGYEDKLALIYKKTAIHFIETSTHSELIKKEHYEKAFHYFIRANQLFPHTEKQGEEILKIMSASEEMNRLDVFAKLTSLLTAKDRGLLSEWNALFNKFLKREFHSVKDLEALYEIVNSNYFKFYRGDAVLLDCLMPETKHELIEKKRLDAILKVIEKIFTLKQKKEFTKNEIEKIKSVYFLLNITNDAELFERGWHLLKKLTPLPLQDKQTCWVSILNNLPKSQPMLERILNDPPSIKAIVNHPQALAILFEKSYQILKQEANPSCLTFAKKIYLQFKQVKSKGSNNSEIQQIELSYAKCLSTGDVQDRNQGRSLVIDVLSRHNHSSLKWNRFLFSACLRAFNGSETGEIESIKKLAWMLQEVVKQQQEAAEQNPRMYEFYHEIICKLYKQNGIRNPDLSKEILAFILLLCDELARKTDYNVQNLSIFFKNLKNSSISELLTDAIHNSSLEIHLIIAPILMHTHSKYVIQNKEAVFYDYLNKVLQKIYSKKSFEPLLTEAIVAFLKQFSNKRNEVINLLFDYLIFGLNMTQQCQSFAESIYSINQALPFDLLCHGKGQIPPVFTEHFYNLTRKIIYNYLQKRMCAWELVLGRQNQMMRLPFAKDGSSIVPTFYCESIIFIANFMYLGLNNPQNYTPDLFELSIIMNYTLEKALMDLDVSLKIQKSIINNNYSENIITIGEVNSILEAKDSKDLNFIISNLPPLLYQLTSIIDLLESMKEVTNLHRSIDCLINQYVTFENLSRLREHKHYETERVSFMSQLYRILTSQASGEKKEKGTDFIKTLSQLLNPENNPIPLELSYTLAYDLIVEHFFKGLDEYKFDLLFKVLRLLSVNLDKIQLNYHNSTNTSYFFILGLLIVIVGRMIRPTNRKLIKNISNKYHKICFYKIQNHFKYFRESDYDMKISYLTSDVEILRPFFQILSNRSDFIDEYIRFVEEVFNMLKSQIENVDLINENQILFHLYDYIFNILNFHILTTHGTVELDRVNQKIQKEVESIIELTKNCNQKESISKICNNFILFIQEYRKVKAVFFDFSVKLEHRQMISEPDFNSDFYPFMTFPIEEKHKVFIKLKMIEKFNNEISNFVMHGKNVNRSKGCDAIAQSLLKQAFQCNFYAVDEKNPRTGPGIKEYEKILKLIKK